jgi:hypothetical protein
VTQPSDPQQNPFPHLEPGPVPGQPTPPAPQPAVASFIPPSVVAAAARPAARQGTPASTIAFVAAIVIAAAGLGFAGGRLTAPASASARGNFANGGFSNFARGSFNPNASGNPDRGLGGAAFGVGDIAIDGQVTAVSSSSITVQTANGQTVTLQLPSTVTYHTQAAGSSTDVTVGAHVQLSVARGNAPTASGGPAPSGQPGNGGFQMDVTDITVLGK